MDSRRDQGFLQCRNRQACRIAALFTGFILLLNLIPRSVGRWRTLGFPWTFATIWPKTSVVSYPGNQINLLWVGLLLDLVLLVICFFVVYFAAHECLKRLSKDPNSMSLWLLAPAALFLLINVCCLYMDLVSPTVSPESLPAGQPLRLYYWGWPLASGAVTHEGRMLEYPESALGNAAMFTVLVLTPIWYLVVTRKASKHEQP